MEEPKLPQKAIAIKRILWDIWGNLDSQILEKFRNLNGKTGQYDVPEVLFQKRTSRSNRVLLRWKILKQNNLTLEQLQTFFGGVCVELVNEDFYNTENKKSDVFNYLVSKIGSDEKISSIITFRNEDGDSGATKARENYAHFVSEPREKYGPIKRNPKVPYSGKGDNSVWEGNSFYSVKGGSQDSFESHANLDAPTLFNPAVEYANELVCLDIDLTMSYFALHCSDIDRSKIKSFDALIKEIESYLKSREYFDGKESFS